MRARKARGSLLFLVLLGGFTIGACAESSRSESEPGPLLPIDGGRKKDAAADGEPLVDGDVAFDGATIGDALSSDGGSIDAPSEGSAGPVPPVADGTISPGEYGVHTNGQNMATSDVDAASPTTWAMTWDSNNVYVAVAFADVNEAVVLYLDTNPLAGSANGGSDADGSLVGYSYDATKLSPLPMRADVVAYVKASYNEVRVADGAGAWGSPTVSASTQVGSGTTREIVIPWTAIRPAGRPSAFGWLGYATSAGGYVYGEMPPVNPGGAVGLAAVFTHYYRVTDATPGTGTKPFANPLTP